MLGGFEGFLCSIAELRVALGSFVLEIKGKSIRKACQKEFFALKIQIPSNYRFSASKFHFQNQIPTEKPEIPITMQSTKLFLA